MSELGFETRVPGFHTRLPIRENYYWILEKKILATERLVLALI